jgi:uroporphyrinogen-III synthase
MNNNSAAQSLQGKAVLVTRPSHQAEKLAMLIVAANGEAVRFPALAIEPPSSPDRVKELLRNLATFDLAVFASANAVDHGLALLGGKWPSAVTVAAVGEGSAAALRNRGITTVVVPSGGADSEALQAVPQLQRLDGKRVLIVRGEGGRELLAEELRLRGAHVTYAECYRRVRPRADPMAIISRWERGALHAVSVMSGETLDNLQAMLGPGGQQLLRNIPLFVPHPSIAERAKSIGLTEVVVTPPGDEGMVRGLCAWFSLRTDGDDAPST